MIASNLVERIHPICAQSKAKVSYLSTNVLIEHSIDSPPVMPIGGVPHYCILRSSPCQRNSLSDFAHANNLCTWGAIGKYQMTFMGPPLVLVPSSDGPFLYRGASHLGHLSKSLYFSPGIICNHWNTHGFFQPRGRWGRSFDWPGMSFLTTHFFSGSIFLIIPNN